MLLIKREQLAAATYPRCCLCHKPTHPDKMAGDACLWCIQRVDCDQCGATGLYGTYSTMQGRLLCPDCAEPYEEAPQTPEEDCRRGDHVWTRDAGDSGTWVAYICEHCGASKIEPASTTYERGIVG